MTSPNLLARRALIVAAALALAACSPTGSGSSTADASHGEGHSGTADEAAVSHDAAWATDLQFELWASPVQVGDVIAVGTTGGSLVGLDPATGEEEWKLSIGAAVRGTPAVDGDMLYLVCDHGWVHAVGADGAEAWRVVLGSPAAERDIWDRYASRPVIADGVVYAATPSGTVAALDAEDGEVLWSIDVASPVSAGLALDGDTLHVGTLRGTHLALSASDGSQLWERPMGGSVTTTPLVVGDQVLAGSRGAALLALDSATGESVWKHGFGSSWVESSAVPLTDDAIVIGSSDLKVVKAINLSDGTPLWSAPVEGWTWGTPTVADGVVYETQMLADGEPGVSPGMYAFDASDGTVLWTAPGARAATWAPEGWVITGAATSPLVVGDLVVVAGLDGVVTAYKR